MAEPKFISGEPAVLAGETLVVSDLHIGIEHGFRRAGIKMPSQTRSMKERLDSLIKKTKAKRLVILGDVKHKVPGSTFQEEREIPEFLEHFSKKVKLEIVPGNHDADLKRLVSKKIKIHPSKGILKDKIYFMHGHAWPDSSFLDADFLVMGHVQPQIEIKDKLGYVWRERVWVRAELDRKKSVELFGKKGKTKSSKVRLDSGQRLPELIVLSSFNKMSGGLALNKKEKLRESPVLKLAKLNKTRIYLLDGTFLGELRKL